MRKLDSPLWSATLRPRGTTHWCGFGWTQNHEAPCGNCHHFLLWVYVPCALAVCCVALAGAELLLQGHHQTMAVRRGRHTSAGKRLDKLLWHTRHMKLELALFLVFLCSIGVPIGRTIDRAGVHDFGVGWKPEEHKDREFWQQMLERSSLYAGMGALIPMSLIGVPLSRTSALWRTLGRSYEEAIAFHRALGHLMMALLTYHSLGYMVEWSSHGLNVLFDELTDWLDCGRCTHINNLAGLISWIAGLLIWASSLGWFRRRNYAIFFNAHQLHLVFFGFGCIHWPACALVVALPYVLFDHQQAEERAHSFQVLPTPGLALCSTPQTSPCVLTSHVQPCRRWHGRVMPVAAHASQRSSFHTRHDALSSTRRPAVVLTVSNSSTREASAPSRTANLPRLKLLVMQRRSGPAAASTLPFLRLAASHICSGIRSASVGVLMVAPR